MEKKEVIVSAAIWFRDGKQYEDPFQPVNIDSGYVLYGLRHGFIYAQNSLVFGRLKEERMERAIEGFITNKRMFLNRVDAFKMAQENNQIIEMIGEQTELYSENLY